MDTIIGSGCAMLARETIDTQLCRRLWGPILAILAVLPVWLPTCAQAADDLAIAPDAVVETIVGTGILGEADFKTIDDPYIGPIVVGGAAEVEADVATGISAIIYPGEQGSEQIQFILREPWGGLAARVEAMAAILTQLVGSTPAAPEFSAEDDPLRDSLSPAAQWLYGLMMESWLGWPGTPQRVVRVIDGVAVIIEGLPPDIWAVTFVPDAGYADWTWPGFSPATDSEEVRAARLAIRAGDYQAAMPLLEAAADRDEPAAAALLGDMYRLGRLGPVDQQLATNWYLAAGRQKYGPAIYGLAMMSDEGWGVMFMTGVRLPLLVDAAEVGTADAVYLLSGQDDGVFYVRNEDLTKFDQVKMAAEWGLLAAQLDLAQRYATGDGVEADPRLAYAWAVAALANTDPGLDYVHAHKLAADLRAGLSDAEAAEAERLAETLVTGPPPPDQIPPQAASSQN